MYLVVENVSKSYENGQKVQVLKGVSTKVGKGCMCVIHGPSGSGKSTLLNTIGALDPVDSGLISVDGVEISRMNTKQLALFRRKTLGFVFQFYNLVPNLTARENIEVCRYLSNKPLEVDELLHAMGLEEHQHKFPNQLSGGQQQRCSIARALVKNPKLLLCDEPTGALDSQSSQEMMVLLEQINQKYGTTMLLVTHNMVICEMMHQVIEIKDGKIAQDYTNKTRVSAARLAW